VIQFWIFDFGLWKKAVKKIIRSKSLSVNDPKSKTCSTPCRRIHNRKLPGIVVMAVAFATCGAFANAQQATKVGRIGFLDSGTASGTAVLLEAFRQSCVSLDGLKERISSSSTGLPSKKMSAYLSLRPNWFD
jgi:hypothetical protein